jgi:hypothetical protein
MGHRKVKDIVIGWSAGTLPIGVGDGDQPTIGLAAGPLSAALGQGALPAPILVAAGKPPFSVGKAWCNDPRRTFDPLSKCRTNRTPAFHPADNGADDFLIRTTQRAATRFFHINDGCAASPGGPGLGFGSHTD